MLKADSQLQTRPVLLEHLPRVDKFGPRMLQVRLQGLPRCRSVGHFQE